MIKVGFICEGYTEQRLLRSDQFKIFLSSINLQFVKVINAEGAGNLLPHNILSYIKILENEGAQVIVILTDLDDEVCITKTKQRIKARSQDILVIAVKKIEAWFLANEPAMKLLLNDAEFMFSAPENVKNPFETIIQLMVNRYGRSKNKYSRASKIKLVDKLINSGFDLSQSAKHPNCPSAKYFIDKLIQIGKK